MRWNVCLAAVLASLLLSGSAAAEPEECTVNVRLRDGTRFSNATLKMESFKVQTDFGTLTVKVSNLKSINLWNNRLKVELKDGNSIVGKIEPAEWELKTSLGDVKIQVAKIQDLTVSRQRAPVAGAAPARKTGVLKDGVKYREERRQRYGYTGYSATVSRDGKFLGVVLPDKGEVAIYDTAAGSLGKVKVGQQPRHVLFDNGRAIVANYESSNLSVIDLKSYKVVKTVSVPSAPYCTASYPNADFIYVSCKTEYTGKVYKYDLKTWKEKGTIRYESTGKEPRDAPSSLILTDDGRYAYWSIQLIVLKDDLKAACTMSHMMSFRPPVYVDWGAGRLYSQGNVFTLDVAKKSRTLSNVSILAPHDKVPVVFACVANNRYDRNRNESLYKLRVLDEETFKTLKDVDLGDVPIRYMFPTEKTLFFVTDDTIFKLAVSDLVPESQMKKSKKRVIAYNPLEPAAPENITKAAGLLKKAEKSLKDENASKLLEEAQELDPLCGAAVLEAQILFEKKENEKAYGRLKQIAPLSFRRFDLMVRCRELLGRCCVEMKKPREAVDSYKAGLALEGTNTALRELLGDAYKEQGTLKTAYLEYTRCKKDGSKSKSLSLKTKAVILEIQKKTSMVCPSCKGDGEEEVWIEEDGRKYKTIHKCPLCKGKKKVWEKPCEACGGWGKKGFDEWCEDCQGKGYTPEPVNK